MFTKIGKFTLSDLTKSSILCSICDSSEAPKKFGGNCTGWYAVSDGNSARLITAHQIGTVLDKASGITGGL